MPHPYADSRARRSLMWWAHDLDDHPGLVGAAAVSYAKQLEDQQSTKDREERFRRYARLYGNATILGLKPWEYSRVLDETRVTRNVIASCVETATAMIAANRPAPQFLTNGADYKLRRKAEKLNKFGKGLLHASGFYRLAPSVFRDGAIFGTGFSKILDDEGEICTERVFPWDILVEDTDALYGKPRTLTQRMYIPRDVALARWPDAADAIRSASGIDRGQGDSQASDHIAFYESWHLPSSKKAKDGRHVIALERHAVLYERWTRPQHPFAIFRWEEPMAGFWGRGIPERLQGLQVEINRLLIKVQESMHLGGMFKVILEAGGGVPKAHVNNEIGAIYMVNPGARPPTVVPQQSVHPEILTQIDKLEVKAFDEIGISQMASRSEKPAGLDSGVALREYNDIKSDRFVMVGRAWEQLHLDVVDVGIEVARSIRGFSVDVPDKNAKVEIRWADVDLERDGYILQCFPTSLLPQTPAGRVQGVQDLINIGALPQDNVLEMLNVPDLEEITDLATSSRRAVRARVAAMLDEPMESAYQAPDPRMNLMAAIQYVNSVYLEESEKGCPEERLDLLRQYVDECVDLVRKSQQPAAQDPAAGPATAPQPVAAPAGAPSPPMPMAA